MDSLANGDERLSAFNCTFSSCTWPLMLICVYADHDNRPNRKLTSFVLSHGSFFYCSGGRRGRDAVGVFVHLIVVAVVEAIVSNCFSVEL